ncbi:precorrin-6y C5,15-methyltransferase (decarboxylating) subunit CbiE [Amycolatopsis azurea]|uniref:Bifunctional cobalt-precorrin-7 (C(5))-methyltransferase/cobalt-precorrin-6B (C(15))-methyltransferase n=1 Tax=Amycolatopsis azurea DSM 43854 TaxID=1238180 RepID=M2QF53_9PSEU|nr:precorrin-6y C5,15-methyltransferase (decarboxylating) subunit CbiE [Amycolatopsis azurea]EMD24667.1 Cobalt-precorrin-6y C5-methyltransferase [Amycolatopsis azurea DSM 43854]OOC02134.1 bifunctional cobalt-precorrin-7 (C(5))-methyltransferase/cobalt-precorrin-6B (C(15))-methyltransferase [Amycolatopsis azurea DSM 43854]
MTSVREKSPLTVVGIGADGWSGLSGQAREAVLRADVVVGAPRQLAYLPAGVQSEPWPSPLLPALDDFLAGRSRVCVLASGDPLLSGIGTTLVQRGYDVEILPALSSVTLARAKLGWSAEETEVVTVVGRAIGRVSRALAPGRKILVLGANAEDLLDLLKARGYEKSRVTALSDLGGPEERIGPGSLTVFAIEADGPALPLTGLPDDAFEHDGQLTKRDLRASALARLAPSPGELLWDVGAGAGSVGIEWSRVHPLNRAIAIERSPERAARITRNAHALGVPELDVVIGDAPDALEGLTRPHAIFVGGGLTVPGVLDACLATGARIVAHGVTLESEQALARAYTEHGGELIRVGVEQAAPLGGFTGWTPARAVTQWSYRSKA